MLASILKVRIFVSEGAAENQDSKPSVSEEEAMCRANLQKELIWLQSGRARKTFSQVSHSCSSSAHQMYFYIAALMKAETLFE